MDFRTAIEVVASGGTRFETTTQDFTIGLSVPADGPTLVFDFCERHATVTHGARDGLVTLQYRNSVPGFVDRSGIWRVLPPLDEPIEAWSRLRSPSLTFDLALYDSPFGLIIRRTRLLDGHSWLVTSVTEPKRNEPRVVFASTWSKWLLWRQCELDEYELIREGRSLGPWQAALALQGTLHAPHFREALAGLQEPPDELLLWPEVMAA